MQNSSHINPVETLNPPTIDLPARRTLWPREAQEAYGEVLKELNSWCRDLDHPPAGNGWIAETAVRETWRAGDSANRLPA